MDFHIEEREIAEFYRRWTRDPDSVSDDEFDAIQLHLLECEACSSIAKAWEDRFRKTGEPPRAAAFPEPVSLKTQTLSLCGELAEVERLYLGKTIPFDALEGRFRAVLQPKCARIAQLLLHHAPDTAPEIAAVHWVENVREIEWRDAGALLSPLTPESAAEQLHRIREILMHLLAYLHE